MDGQASSTGERAFASTHRSDRAALARPDPHGPLRRPVSREM